MIQGVAARCAGPLYSKGRGGHTLVDLYQLTTIHEEMVTEDSKDEKESYENGLKLWDFWLTGPILS